jgi:hypothetical protein
MVDKRKALEERRRLSGDAIMVGDTIMVVVSREIFLAAINPIRAHLRRDSYGVPEGGYSTLFAMKDGGRIFAKIEDDLKGAGPTYYLAQSANKEEERKPFAHPSPDGKFTVPYDFEDISMWLDEMHSSAINWALSDADKSVEKYTDEELRICARFSAVLNLCQTLIRPLVSHAKLADARRWAKKEPGK